LLIEASRIKSEAWRQKQLGSMGDQACVTRRNLPVFQDWMFRKERTKQKRLTKSHREAVTLVSTNIAEKILPRRVDHTCMVRTVMKGVVIRRKRAGYDIGRTGCPLFVVIRVKPCCFNCPLRAAISQGGRPWGWVGGLGLHGLEGNKKSGLIRDDSLRPRLSASVRAYQRIMWL
jgi:hypothetical protein